MPQRFVGSKTAYLYENPTGGARHMVLIFGDEVQTSGGVVGTNRRQVTFRGRTGYVTNSNLRTSATLETYFIDVGQGDSTFIVTPGRRKILVDGGIDHKAIGFLAWKYRLDDPNNSVDIDLLVLSHADEDHLAGLVPIITHPQIHVQRVVHSGIATFSSGAHATRLGDLDASGTFLVTRHDTVTDLAGEQLSSDFQPWIQAISAEGCAYGAVDSSVGTIDIGEPAIGIDVLGPRLTDIGAPAYAWFDPAGKTSLTINGHSVILRLRYGGVSLLLAGDLNTDGGRHLRADPAIRDLMDAHILKCPHHGSHDFDTGFLEAVRPQWSVISSGDEPDHGHPRAPFIGAVGLASRPGRPMVFSTEIAATFVDVGEDHLPQATGNLSELNYATSAANATARRLFKQRLPGIINLRTDGRDLYAARRVSAGYWWEAYGPEAPSPRPTVFGPGQ